MVKERPQQQTPAPVRVGGVVKDKKGHPLPGVTVLIKGTMMGVVTDENGDYSIELPDSKDIRLIFSFIGMKAQDRSRVCLLLLCRMFFHLLSDVPHRLFQIAVPQRL